MEPYPGYCLTRQLGTGAFGQVWEAETPKGRKVALKFIACAGDRSAAREIRSLQAVRELQHPHLIRIENVWCCAGYLVIAMERADGSLLDLLKTYQARQRTPVTAEHACLLLAEAATAIDFLNTKQHWINGRCVAIQHCDIKPSNLLLLGERVKVADFGLSTFLTCDMENSSRAGTLDYCAPEIFQGRLSGHTDQYALAVTYCLLRGGRLPFANTPRFFDPCYVRPAPDLTMLPASERPVMERALTPVPQDRWPTCTEFLQQLIGRVWLDMDRKGKKPAAGTGSLPPVRTALAAPAGPLVR
jgi:serine/threonine protein kinase, bacterial